MTVFICAGVCCWLLATRRYFLQTNKNDSGVLRSFSFFFNDKTITVQCKTETTAWDFPNWNWVRGLLCIRIAEGTVQVVVSQEALPILSLRAVMRICDVFLRYVLRLRGWHGAFSAFIKSVRPLLQRPHLISGIIIFLLKIHQPWRS